MGLKKLLIITYYWPPSGGAGVQRWLKFTKYLPQYGWKPVVYIPENPHYPVLDGTLQKDVPPEAEIVKHPVWEPYGFYKKWMGMNKEDRVQHGFISEKGQSEWKQKLSTWVRGNFFIPDARMFWIKPSIIFLTEYLKDHPVDAIASTGPPHSTHMIALGVKKNTGLPWLCDFRDPWTEIDFYEQLMLTGWADRKHKRMEKKVLENADMVTTVSWNWGEGLKKLGAKKLSIITNGYDHEDAVIGSEADKHGRFEILHVGSLNKDRNPKNLWTVLKELIEEEDGFSEKLKITLIGKNDVQVVSDARESGLESFLNLPPYMPHSEVFKKLAAASILLLPLNDTPNVEGIIPGKLFEYLSAKRPILCIGSKTGDSAKIIEGANAGKVIDFADRTTLKKTITEFYHRFLNNDLKIDSSGIEKYSRQRLTEELVKLLEDLITEK